MKEYGHEFADFRYYMPTEFELRGGIWPVRAGNNIAKSNYAVGPRRIECYSIHFILNGSVDFAFEDGRTRLNKGDLFCLYPGRKHSYQAADYASHSPLRLHWLAFDGPQALSLLERIGLFPERPYLREKLSTELIDLLRQHFAWLREEGMELNIQQSMYRLFAMLSLPRSARNKKEADWMKKSEDYIHNHYMEPITVSDIAAIAGVHRSHLYVEFVRSHGMSPKRYLLMKRMERAQELLRNDSLTVTEIALSLGYADVYAFSRAFCQYIGYSPTVYRLRVRASQLPEEGGPEHEPKAARAVAAPIVQEKHTRQDLRGH